MHLNRSTSQARISPMTAAVVALAALIAGGLVHGRLSERWQMAPALSEALARLPHVPMNVGLWQGRDSDSIAANDFEKAGALGYIVRTYQHADGATVELILMCGRPDRMGAHTPEICYGGVGYELTEPATVIEIRDTSGETGRFRKGRFTKSATRGSALTLYWGWNADGTWNAPSSPRWTYLFQPYLYKLYLSSHGRSGRAAEGGIDVGERFLRDLIPALKEKLSD
jgi:hypothetical protein